MKALPLLLILCMACTGCELPVAKAPMGTPWQEHEVAQLNAPWLLPGLGLPVHFVAKKNGHGLAGMLTSEAVANTSGDSDLKLTRIDCVFTRIGKHEFLFYKGIETEEDKQRAKANQTPPPDGYFFFYIAKRDKNLLTLAMPATEFKTLVESGRLPGEIWKDKKRSYPLIDNDEKAFLAVIESVGLAKCFDLKNQVMAERIEPKTTTK